MSVTKSYTAEFSLVAGREYTFFFELIGTQAFELWATDSEDNRWLIPPNQYTMKLTGTRPLFDGGVVTLNDDPAEEVFQYVAVRNTPIDQTVDFQNFTRFPEVLVEFAMDKLTMIAQELNDKLCDQVPGEEPATPLTQELIWESYDPFPAGNLNFALDKMTQICVELDATKAAKAGLPPQ